MSHKSFNRKDLDEDLSLFHGRIIPFVKEDVHQPWQQRKKLARDEPGDPPVYEQPPRAKGIQGFSRLNALMKDFSPTKMEQTLRRTDPPLPSQETSAGYKGRLAELEALFKGHAASLTKKLDSLEHKIDDQKKEDIEDPTLGKNGAGIQDVILSDALVHRLTQALFQKMKASLKGKEEDVKSDNPFLRQGRIRIDIEL
jgi:hypothetical protein